VDLSPAFIMITWADLVPEVYLSACTVIEQDPGRADNCAESGGKPATLCSQNFSLLFPKVPFPFSTFIHPSPTFFHLQIAISTNTFRLYSQPTASIAPAAYVPRFLLALCLFFPVPKDPVPPSSLFPQLIFLLL